VCRKGEWEEVYKDVTVVRGRTTLPKEKAARVGGFGILLTTVSWLLTSYTVTN